MEDLHIQRIATEMDISEAQVSATVHLLDEGGTIPFIARYRKEATGSLDEVVVASIRDRSQQLRELDKRRTTILNSLEENGHLDDALRGQVMQAQNLAELEDLYLPYRPKRRTRATAARERGLAPLADLLFAQDEATDPPVVAEAYVDPEKGVDSVDDALAGARDIIAEIVNEHAEARARIRELFLTRGVYRSRLIPGKEAEGSKYRDYFEWDEPVVDAPSHRVLAMRRGEKELVLSLRVLGPEAEAVAVLDGIFVLADNPCAEQVKTAVRDAYKRLLSVSMETEIRVASKERADAEAIRIFVANLRQLLLAAPLGQKRVMAIDPGFRTGCKLVCLDAQGKLLHTDVIYPERHAARAVETVRSLCSEFGLEAVAIGNGTGGRETEAFIRSAGLPGEIPVVMVNESGASVYSASAVAREEFPDHDLTVRGAVSIGRRLMDPLAELVKIEPRSIGVGQYQHDVDQHALKQSLDDVVASCVNSVGVEVNTASRELLTYVSGLGPQLAAGIVRHRDEHGPFTSRTQLMAVPRLGPRAYELAAGFLRIRDGANPLDASAVHPERYAVVDRMAADLGMSVETLIGNRQRLEGLRLDAYEAPDLGLPTLQDIVAELARPGRDPRRDFAPFAFAAGVTSLEDLAEGMRVPGVVTNITAFGAFVDIGVHQDGLVHISQLADRYVKDPNEVVHVGQQIKVRVVSVDTERRRIGLSMRSGDSTAPTPAVQLEKTVTDKADTRQSTDGRKSSSGKDRRPRQNRTSTADRRQQSGNRPRQEAPTALAEALRKVGLNQR